MEVAASVLIGDVVVRRLGDGDSVEQLTTLLHRSYADHAEAGRVFFASYQSVQDTAHRVAGGECWLALRGSELVGSVTVACMEAPCAFIIATIIPTSTRSTWSPLAIWPVTTSLSRRPGGLLPLVRRLADVADRPRHSPLREPQQAVRCQVWVRDIDRPHLAALAPGLSAGISLEEVPPLVRDADPRPGRFGWQASAEPSVGDPYLWCAAFSGSTPHDLVAIFAAALASPHPVPRSCLPAGVEGQLTVVSPGAQRQRRARGPE